ncbi:MAG: helicase-associated domain-containing protein [Caldilineaceae bacterium]
MPTLEKLTATDVRNHVGTGNYNKARKYLNRVSNAVRAGHTLTAKVRGAYVYELEIDVEADGIFGSCSCPYNRGGSTCKHIGALLLKWVEEPATFTVRAGSPSAPADPLPVTPVAAPPSTPPKQRPPWMVASFAQQQAADDAKLAAQLNEQTVQTLRALAKKRKWNISGTRKDDIVQQIVAQMASLPDNAKTVYSLDDEHRNVLRACALLSGDEQPLPSRVGQTAKLWGALGSYAKIETYGSHLSDQGLTVPAETYHYPPRMDFVPRALARHLPPLLETVIPSSKELPPDLAAPAAGVDVRIGNPQTFVRTVNQVLLLMDQIVTRLRPPMPRPRLETFVESLKGWDYLPEEIIAQKARLQDRRSEVTLTVPPPAYILTDDAIERLAPIAGGEAQLDFMLALLTAAGVVQPGSPVTLWPDGKQAYLQRTEAEQRALLARTYFALENWNELWELLRTHGDLQLKRVIRSFYYPGAPQLIWRQMMQARNLILRTLAHLPDNRWVPLTELQPLLRVLWPSFEQEALQVTPFAYDRQRPWYLTRRGAPLDTAKGPDWMAAQWNFIRFMLTGPLHWLGLADIAVRENVPVAVRLRGLADLYWDRVEAPPFPSGAAGQMAASAAATAYDDAAAATPTLAVEDANIRVNPSAISAQAHALLDKIALLQDAAPGAFVYRLDVQAVHQTFEDGQALADLVDEWQTHFQRPMPEPVHAQLMAWWQRYGQVRIYEDVTIIEFADDYALAEMKAVTGIEKVLIAEISPRLVLIPRSAVAPLTAELEKAGYTPKVQG